MRTTRRRLLKAGGLASILAAARLPLPARAQGQDRYARFRGQTISFNYPVHPHFDQAEKLFADFTRETGIKVARDKMQYLRMKDKQVQEMSKPQGDYDLITYVVMWKTEYAARGFIEPLDPYLKNPALADPRYALHDLITPYYQNISLVGGPKSYLPGPGARPYGLPFGAETDVLAYRRDILAKHGLQVPATYAELLHACRVVREREPGMGGLSSRGENGHQVSHAWLLHLSPFAGQVFDARWHAAFAGEAGIKAAEFLTEIVQTGPAGIPNFGFGDMQNAFLQGQSAFYLDSISIFGPAQDSARSRIAGQVGYAIHPKAAVHSGQTGGFGLAIPSNAKNKEAAFLFMQWLTSREQDTRIAILGGSAGRWSTLDLPGLARQYSAEFPVLREALKIANPDWRPLIPEWDGISQQILGQALHDVITGKTSAKAALAAAAPAAEQVLRTAGWLKA